jgi:hypothetical protein
MKTPHKKKAKMHAQAYPTVLRILAQTLGVTSKLI